MRSGRVSVYTTARRREPRNPRLPWSPPITSVRTMQRVYPQPLLRAGGLHRWYSPQVLTRGVFRGMARQQGAGLYYYDLAPTAGVTSSRAPV